MTKEEFKLTVKHEVEDYIRNWDQFGHNPRLRVNPANLELRIYTASDFARAVEDADEVIENAAIAEGDETEQAGDWQAQQNPDFYPLRSLISAKGEETVPDMSAIDRVARKYFNS